MIYKGSSTPTVLRVTIANKNNISTFQNVSHAFVASCMNAIGHDVDRYQYHLENGFINTFHYVVHFDLLGHGWFVG